ncbi:MAG: hypothetical protein IPP15_03750 [Saprospiraceae bacterium]|uniref:Uncharacterized protein n=1 Tax=Candidatus Opimibacter skivensis TaxID=2982028 RepID=A0A9D7STH3_9BACT|nr:hypothetical protein [Candidatus Opimibacter skivensis]
MTPFATYIIPESTIKETSQPSKWLWIIVDQPLLPPHEELLQKICEALKADFSQSVKVIVCSNDDNIILSGLNSESASLVISFGIQPSSLGIWIDLNSQGIRYLESFCFILTISLADLINQPAAKKQLWSSMQSYIHLKLNDQKNKESGL